MQRLEERKMLTVNALLDFTGFDTQLVAVGTFNEEQQFALRENIQSGIDQVLDDFDVDLHRDLENPELTVRFGQPAPVDIPDLLGRALTPGFPDFGNQFNSVVDVYAANFDFIASTLPSGMDLVQGLSNAITRVAVHEMAHSFGLLHYDVYGTPDIAPPVDVVAVNDVTGQQTPHVMASGATGLSNEELFVAPEQLAFSPYSIAKLEFAQDLTPNPVNSANEVAGNNNALADAQALALTNLPISNVAAVNVAGTLDTLQDVDSYRITGQQGDLLTVNVLSELLREDSNIFDSMVSIRDNNGNLLAWNNDIRANETHFGTGVLHSTDSMILNYELPENGDYFVQVQSANNVGGDYNLFANLTNPDWERLGNVDFQAIDNVDASDVRSYVFSTRRNGTLSIESLFSHAAGNSDLSLFRVNATGTNLVATGNSLTDGERIDINVQQGETYLLQVLGTNADVDLRIANLLEQIGDSVTVFGTDDADSLTVSAVNSPTFDITINDVSYQITRPSPATLQTISFEGGAETDSTNIFTSTADDTARLFETGFRVIGSGYVVVGHDVELKSVFSNGGNDSATLFDSPGDDRFDGFESMSTLHGDGFSNHVEGFDSVTAYATRGGHDQAFLYDSTGDDQFDGAETISTLYGNGFSNQARSFDEVYAYASSGNDTAHLHDSTGNDTFVGLPKEGLLSGSSFRNQARNFDTVTAFATNGGNDIAFLHDSSGNDRFDSFPSHSTLHGTGFSNRAENFEEVYADATNGGNDTAFLYDSAGDDVFVGQPDEGLLYGSFFRNQAQSFEEVYAYSNNGGNDAAFLYDSAGDDVFVSTVESELMYGNSFRNEVTNFELVYGRATASGNDHAIFHDSSGNDTFFGRQDHGYLSRDGHFAQQEDFEQVSLYGNNGGINTLDIDSLNYAFSSFGTWI